MKIGLFYTLSSPDSGQFTQENCAQSNDFTLKDHISRFAFSILLSKHQKGGIYM